jgi:hypothetical protein
MSETPPTYGDTPAPTFDSLLEIVLTGDPEDAKEATEELRQIYQSFGTTLRGWQWMTPNI